MAEITGRLGTVIGPLTTTWTMPSDCSIFYPDCQTCDVAFQAQTCADTNGGNARDFEGCWPPATSRAAIPQWPFVGWGFYSPGLVCPAGFAPACTAVWGKRPDWSIEFSLEVGETAIGCCPE